MRRRVAIRGQRCLWRGKAVRGRGAWRAWKPLWSMEAGG
ncbi:hypothetical protein F383_28889 [Gossypium arboreum]|uniref:Uncharacterized protein n=1 Tax=Gossypium arboreum TaxID=29729 RepID=A0A0B0MX17_GOSAR|nr:hypothetical protein F383_28889 [Gossypium arboreum]